MSFYRFFKIFPIDIKIFYVKSFIKPKAVLGRNFPSLIESAKEYFINVPSGSIPYPNVRDKIELIFFNYILTKNAFETFAFSDFFLIKIIK